MHSAVSLLRWLSSSESSSDDDDGVGGRRFCGGCFFFAGCFLEGLATGFFVPDDGFFVLGGIAARERAASMQECGEMLCTAPRERRSSF